MSHRHRLSAGLLLYRRGSDGAIEVLIAHPGGPLWARRDDAAWSIPKGEYQPDEPALDAARREFGEETGLPVPDGPFLELGSARQPSSKLVSVWAVSGDPDLTRFASNHFELEWPPRSGRRATFPEVDRVQWFGLSAARAKLLVGQRVFIDRLQAALGEADAGADPSAPTAQ